MADSTHKKFLDAALKTLLATVDTTWWLKGPAVFVSEVSSRFGDLPDEQRALLVAAEPAEVRESIERIYTQSRLATENAADAAAGVHRIEETIGSLCRLFEDLSRTGLRDASDNFSAAGIFENANFVGRDEELKRLHELLFKGNAQITQAVVGEAGIGKTELAQAYLFRHAGYWEGRYWLDASEAALDGSASRLAQRLFGFGFTSDKTPEEIREALIEHLGKGRNLLVLDNMESPRRAAVWRLHNHARVLITSRSRRIAPAVANELVLDVLDMDAAVQLLTRQRPDLQTPARRAAVEAIAKHLGRLALALAVTGAALADLPHPTPEDILRRLETAEVGTLEDPFEERDPEEMATGYRHRVAASLSLHFQRLRSGAAMKVLAAASFCHSTAIPTDLLATAAESTAEELSEAVTLLHGLSIVRCDTTVTIHRLMQSVVRARLEVDSRRRYTEKLVEIMLRSFHEPDDPTHRIALDKYDAHAAEVWGHARRLGGSRNAANLANRHAAYLENRARFADAEREHREILVVRQSTFEGDHALIAQSLSNLVGVLKAQGRASEAEESCRRALAMYRRLFRGDHADIARTLNNLQSVLFSLGRFSLALEACEEALGMRERLHPGGDLDVAMSLDNLGTILQQLQRYDRAEQCHVRALELRQRLLSGDHHDLANSLTNVAMLNLTRGDLDQAEVYCRQALDMRGRLFTGDHPSVADSLSNLGCVLLSQRNFVEAKRRLEMSLDMRQRLFGRPHPDVAASLHNLGLTHCSIEDLRAAERFLAEALEMRQQLFPGGHPDTVLSLTELAHAFELSDRWADAEPLHAEACAMVKRLSPDDDVIVINKLSEWAYVLGKLGRPDEAGPLLYESLAMAKRLFPGDHPLVAQGLSSVAVLLHERGERAEACRLITEAAAMSSRVLGSDHAQTQGFVRLRKMICGDGT